MSKRNIPPDEWIELVAETLEDEYTILVEDGELLLTVGDKPQRPDVGIPLAPGAKHSGTVDRGDAIWARAAGSSDVTARAVSGLQLESTEVAGLIERPSDASARRGTTEILKSSNVTVSGGTVGGPVFNFPSEARVYSVYCYIDTRNGADPRDLHVDILFPRSGDNRRVGFDLSNHNFIHLNPPVRRSRGSAVDFNLRNMTTSDVVADFRVIYDEVGQS